MTLSMEVDSNTVISLSSLRYFGDRIGPCRGSSVQSSRTSLRCGGRLATVVLPRSWHGTLPCKHEGGGRLRHDSGARELPKRGTDRSRDANMSASTWGLSFRISARFVTVAIDPTIRRAGVTEYGSGTAASVQLDVRGPDHLAPFLGVVCDELAEIGRAHV